MQSSFELTPSTFIQQFELFCQLLEEHPRSDGPFESFKSGLAYREEGYKAYIHDMANQRLDVASWKESAIGSGAILECVIRAIEIDEGGDRRRNNLVQWSKRWGPEGWSHHKLRLAKDGPLDQRREIERHIYRFYRQLSSHEEAFSGFITFFGRRYDLIAYLFFIHDWEQFMPIGPTTFERAFSQLGIPYKLSGRCSWENYQGYLARLKAIHQSLEGVVRGTDLVEAHSFCWMLARFSSKSGKETVQGRRQRKATFMQCIPEAAGFPRHQASTDEGREVDFDQVTRGRRRIGAIAQCVVLEAEQNRLKEQGRPDLAKEVRDVSLRPALGYDIESFTEAGERKPIEVKAAASQGDDLKFFLSENERRKSRSLPHHTFALVVDPEAEKPTIIEFPGSSLLPECLRPINYEARIKWPTDQE